MGELEILRRQKWTNTLPEVLRSHCPDFQIYFLMELIGQNLRASPYFPNFFRLSTAIHFHTNCTHGDSEKHFLNSIVFLILYMQNYPLKMFFLYFHFISKLERQRLRSLGWFTEWCHRQTGIADHSPRIQTEFPGWVGKTQLLQLSPCASCTVHKQEAESVLGVGTGA